MDFVGVAVRKMVRVLVVEDNLDLQQYLYLQLKDSYDVIMARNGAEALQQLKALPNVSLIVTDLMMPEMDGYQLVEALKSKPETSSIPVIMLTASAEKESRLKVLRLVVDDYLNKPFATEELNTRIENLLRNYQVRLAQDGYEKFSEADGELLKKFEGLAQRLVLALI